MENYFLDVLLCLHCYTKQKQTGFDKLTKTSEIYIYILYLLGVLPSLHLSHEADKINRLEAICSACCCAYEVV